MRSLATTVTVLFAAVTAGGCATGLQGLGVVASIRHGGGSAQPTFSEFAAGLSSYSQERENARVDGTAEPTTQAEEPADGFVAVSDTGIHWTDEGDHAPPAPEPLDQPASDEGAEAVAVPGVDSPAAGVIEAAPATPIPAQVEPPLPALPAIDSSSNSDVPLVPQPEAPLDEASGDRHGPSLGADLPAAASPPYDAATGYPVAEVQTETWRQEEVVPTPQPDEVDAFKPHTDEADTDRFTRRLTDIPLDIRPTEGIMPGNPGAAKLAATAVADPRQFHQVPGIGLSCTPWTICFRPLYFEEVALERYGDRAPCCLQPAVSGVRFFSHVALLPYKMRVRPPRSFVCSNGFSRVGDCPLPGYGECVWRWDAAAVEMAAVTGFVFILP